MRTVPNDGRAEHRTLRPAVTAISLFSGCGGSDLALERNGFRIVWANDAWSHACSTYKDNIKSPAIKHGDIATFSKFPKAKLLVGCYPCQGYSQGGRRDSRSPVNYLYREFDRVLRLVRPRAFVVENVNGMVYGDNRRLLANQLRRYRTAGYRVQWKVLDAKDYGVPQTRKRIFIVGIRSDLEAEYEFPAATHGPGTRRPFKTQRDAIFRTPRTKDDVCAEEMTWFYLSRNRRHPWGKPSPCIVGHWRNVPLHPDSPALRRQGADRWRFSVTAGRLRARRLSYKECALLQGFPSRWRWRHGSIRQRYQLIGNAVPPPLFQAVLKQLPDIWR
jgi:DNA (cytosine-5)-methyltransferase 1